MMDQGLQQTATPPFTSAPVPYVGGVAMEGNASINAREQAKRDAETANNKPLIQGLAGFVRECFDAAKDFKEEEAEERMLRNIRARRGEYDPETLSELKNTGGSAIYMMLTSSKCRAAASWIRDVVLGAKDEKPWTITPTPLPDLPPMMAQSVAAIATREAEQFEQMSGQTVGPREMEQVVSYVKDRIVANAKKRAKEACERMELKMEDQLVEGKFQLAVSAFIEDIVTFPAAVLKGPVVRNKKKLKWVPDGDGYTADVQDTLTLEWERVDPLMAYPAPYSTNVDDGYFIERHKLSRQQLNEMIGVEGYNEPAIRAVLDDYGTNGYSDWLSVDSERADAEGRSQNATNTGPNPLIDALQFWGYVQGKMLVEWGMDESTVPDQDKDYQCEVWLIDRWVIKAQLNPDPMGRVPYYKSSYEEVPGMFWGNAVACLCRDAQTQCNAAARAIHNNTGIASGPQVGFNVDRLPQGEDVTQMYPWKIWQFTSDPYGSSQAPITFFAPPLVVGELMQVYSFFSNLADEHTSIPRFMAGDAQGQGALRTSSGISMLMNNAGKGIKQVVSNIDRAIGALIERLHFYNMKYGKDPELKGDINVVARGANSLIVKETQAQRTNEFLQLVLNSPVVANIVGEEAVAQLLRVGAKNLDFDTDSLVPPPEVIRARIMQQQQQQAQAQKAAQDFQMAMSLAPSQEVEVERGPNGEMLGMKVMDKVPHVMPQMGVAGPAGAGGPQGSRTMSNPNQTTGGTPVSDFFSPMRT